MSNIIDEMACALVASNPRKYKTAARLIAWAFKEAADVCKIRCEILNHSWRGYRDTSIARYYDKCVYCGLEKEN